MLEKIYGGSQKLFKSSVIFSGLCLRREDSLFLVDVESAPRYWPDWFSLNYLRYLSPVGITTVLVT